MHHLFRFLFCAGLYSALLVFSLPTRHHFPVTVKTPYGDIKGISTHQRAQRFTLPYAQPPTEGLRFANPKPIKTFGNWQYDASKMPPSCYQSSSNIRGGNPPSEDCLYVTLYRPNTFQDLLPVFIWLPGGSFISGSASNAGLDGSIFATSQDAIVVVVQYRLGLFGWFQSNNTLDEDNGGENNEPKVSGNQAVRDVVLSMEFLKSILHSFGGDPDRITLAGQSSGAHMVRALLTTPAANSLFHRAVLASDPQNYGLALKENNNELGEYALHHLGCRDVYCARQKSATDILAATLAAFSETPLRYDFVAQREPWRPMIGSYIPISLEHQALNLQRSSKNLIFTTVSTEAGSAIGATYKAGRRGTATVVNRTDSTTYSLHDALSGIFNKGRGNKLVNSSAYPYSDYSYLQDGVLNNLETITTDGLWRCPIQRNVRNLASIGSKIWLAQWNVGMTYPSNDQIAYCLSKGRVCHEDDIYLIFGTGKKMSYIQQVVSREVQRRFGAFIRTGNPDVSGYPSWSAVESGTQMGLLQLGGTNGNMNNTFIDNPRPKQCGMDGIWGNEVKQDWQLYE